MIEEALLAHPAVAFARAISLPDAHAGEVPCAFVELVAGAQVSEGELLVHCPEHVQERAARLKHMTILDELPKTALGKIFKPDLRKHAIRRVYDAALTESGLRACLTEMIDDKKRGLVARIDMQGADDDAVGHVLGTFTRPWERAL